MMAFVAMGLAATTSCTKDNSELILGTWVNTADTYEQYTFNGETEKETTPAGQATITFNENGTMTVTAHDDVDGSIETWTVTYSVNGDNLIWDGETFAIKQLDKKKLILEITESETWEEENGEIFSAQFFMHLDFDRK